VRVVVAGEIERLRKVVAMGQKELVKLSAQVPRNKQQPL